MAFPLHCVLLVLAGVFLLHQAKGECDPDWKEFNKNCYYFSEATQGWNEAVKLCMDRGAYLTDLLNYGDNEYIRTEIMEKRAFYVWVGGHDNGPNTPWLWADNSPIDRGAYLNWERHYPRNISSTNLCMLMEKNNGQWIDEECIMKKQYVCKKDASPTT